MQELERVDGQELNTTEEKTEVYTDSIQESISNYCIDHDLEIKDIYTFDQQRWTAGAYITNATPVIKFKVTDNDSGVNPDTIVIKVDGAKVTTAFTKTAVTGGYECSYTPGTALADGAHTVSIEASDYDGNAAGAKTVSFTVDTIPPTLTLTNPVDGLITNKAALVVSGKTDDVTSKPVTVTVNGTSVTVNSDGSFSKEITLVSGSNTITVVATDKAGKTTTVTRKVTLDTGAPVFEKVTLTPNPVDCGKTFVISVKVTD